MKWGLRCSRRTCAARPAMARRYLALDNGMLREDAVKDIGALLVWLGLQSSFDAKHVVISGVSYGGYLALAALVNYSDRLRGGVDLGGIDGFHQLSEQYGAIPAESAARGIRRRARSGHARVLAADFAADQCGAHRASGAGGARQERSARAGRRVRPAGESSAQPGRRGVVSAGHGRRPRLSAGSRTETRTTGRSRSSSRPSNTSCSRARRLAYLSRLRALLQIHQQQRHGGGRKPREFAPLARAFAAEPRPSFGAPHSTDRRPRHSPCRPAAAAPRGAVADRSPGSAA